MIEEKNRCGAENPEMHGKGIAVMQGGREHWIKIIERSARDLHERVTMQQNMLLAILGMLNNVPPFELCTADDCPHKKVFRGVLLETIGVLEETKKSFKSKRLEILRTRLTEILKETA